MAAALGEANSLGVEVPEEIPGTDESPGSVLYAFVDLEPAPKELPEVFIIPSEVVADVLTKEHAAWLETPRLRGEGDKIDNSMRRILPAYRHEVEGYSDGWMDGVLPRTLEPADRAARLRPGPHPRVRGVPLPADTGRRVEWS